MAKYTWELSFVLCGVGVALLLGLANCGPSEPERAQPTKAPTQPTPVSAQPTETPTQPAGLSAVFPGKTTKDQVIVILGQPARIKTEEGMEVLEYPSAHELMPTGVCLKDGVVVLVGTHVAEEDQLILREIVAQYGEPAKKTYSYYSDGALTYIYPSQGLALIVDEDLDAVFFKQSFVPMSLEEYMQTWGKNLPLEDPYIK